MSITLEKPQLLTAVLISWFQDHPDFLVGPFVVLALVALASLYLGVRLAAAWGAWRSDKEGAEAGGPSHAPGAPCTVLLALAGDKHAPLGTGSALEEKKLTADPAAVDAFARSLVERLGVDAQAPEAVYLTLVARVHLTEMSGRILPKLRSAGLAFLRSAETEAARLDLPES
jgi:hypothetical protein